MFWSMECSSLVRFECQGCENEPFPTRDEHKVAQPSGRQIAGIPECGAGENRQPGFPRETRREGPQKR